MLPELVMVMPAVMLIVDVPELNAHTKFPLSVLDTPLWISEDPVPVTISVSVPAPVFAFTFETGDCSIVPLSTVIVAVGLPEEKKTLLAADETTVAALNVNVTVVSPRPKAKPWPAVVIRAPEVVIKFVPVVAPNIESPKPAEVSVDDTTVSAVADAAAA